MKQTKKKALLRGGVIVLLVVMALSLLVTPILAATPLLLSTTPPVETPAPTPTPPPVASGSPFITAYTVTDGAGNEIQRIKPGEKCRIIVSITDPRITPDGFYTADAPVSGKKLIPMPNIKVTSTGSYSSPSLGDITTTTIKASDLTADGVKYAIILNDITYIGGDNKLAFDLAYADNGRALATLSQSISQCGDIAVATGPASTLVIKDASYGASEVVAGSEFTLTANILAAGGVSGVKNASVSLTLPEQITVVSGSTNVFVGDIKADTTKSVSFKLIASAVANAGSYNIVINTSGTSGAENAAASATMPVTVPITQPERFEISRVNLSEYMNVGEENYANISLINKGKGAIFNVQAEVTGEGLASTEGKLFIGNIQPGTENNSEITLKATKAGTIKATITVTYEDAKTVEKTLTKEVTITVEDMGGKGDIDILQPDIGVIDQMPMPQKGISIWVWLILAAIIIVVAVIVTMIVLKKKKAKKLAAQLMEEEDEDI